MEQRYKQHDAGTIITQYSVVRKFDGKTIEKGKIEKDCGNLTQFTCQAEQNAVQDMLRKRYARSMFDVYATSFTDKGFE